MLGRTRDIDLMGEKSAIRVRGPVGEYREVPTLSGCALFCGVCPKCRGRVVSEISYHEGQKSHHLQCMICGRRYYPQQPPEKKFDFSAANKLAKEDRQAHSFYLHRQFNCAECGKSQEGLFNRNAKFCSKECYEKNRKRELLEKYHLAKQAVIILAVLMIRSRKGRV